MHGPINIKFTKSTRSLELKYNIGKGIFRTPCVKKKEKTKIELNIFWFLNQIITVF